MIITTYFDYTAAFAKKAALKSSGANFDQVIELHVAMLDYELNRALTWFMG